jgi:glycosyltransferase involved in cell wall biosynthesis
MILLAGAVPGEASGNAVSSEVLRAALSEVGVVTQLTHRTSFTPSFQERSAIASRLIELGTQPFAIHGEALLAGAIHGRRLRAWRCAWAVNSRYAGGLLSARIPYAIWEATVTQDELESTSLAEARSSGRGSGIGVAVHSLSLPMGRRIEGLLYRRAKVLCTMSAHTRRRITAVHGIPPEKVILLQHPPSQSYLAALDHVRHRLVPGGAPDESVLRLLFVGRVDDPRKNVVELLRAVIMVRSTGTCVRLTVVGPFSEAWRIRFGELLRTSDARLLGRVSVERLAEEYLSHDVFVLPSRQEGFGVVVAEALHAGLPVISTHCAGPEETIRASEGGVLVDHGAQAIAAAIQMLAADRSCRLGLAEKARSYAERELSFPLFTARVRSLTEDLLRSGKRLSLRRT